MTKLRWLFSGALVFAAGAFSARAEACSCADTGPRLVWPRPSETSVPLDTPLVFQSLFDWLALVGPPADAGAARPLPPDDVPAEPPGADAGAGGLLPPPGKDPVATDAGAPFVHPSGVHLVTADGGIVLLVETQARHTPGCGGDYRFFGPEGGALTANTTYQVFHGETKITAFTTGTGRRDRAEERAAARAVDIATLGSLDGRIATAFLSNVTAPLYVHYVGSLEEVTYALGMNEAASPVTAYDVGLLTCPIVELLGVDGEVLDERELCEPTRCTDVGQQFSLSSCGGNPSVGVDYAAFTALPLGCEGGGPGPASTMGPASSGPLSSNPPPAASTEDGTASTVASGATSPGDQPEPRKVPLQGDSGPTNDGCSVASLGRTPSWATGLSAWVTLLLGVAAVALRRRSGQT